MLSLLKVFEIFGIRATNDADMKPQPSVITLLSLLGEVVVVVVVDTDGAADAEEVVVAVVVTVVDRQSSITDICSFFTAGPLTVREKPNRTLSLVLLSEAVENTLLFTNPARVA